MLKGVHRMERPTNTAADETAPAADTLGTIDVVEALPTDAPADHDALGDVLASGALAGYRQAPPSPGAAAIDAPALARLDGPACGHVGLRYLPFTGLVREGHPLTRRTRTRLSYRAFGRCPACGASVEW